MRIQQAEYIWLDGATPTQRLRSKSRIIAFRENDVVKIDSLPEWSFDGSSTYQSNGDSSDLLLKPIRLLKDPLRGAGNFLVLCEVFNADGSPHTTNTRAALRRMMEIRSTEERIQGLFLENLVRGTTHLCIGQEACSVGVAQVLEPGDTVTCTYRGHGHAGADTARD